MSITFCKECDRIVEGETFHGMEISVNVLTGTKDEREYTACKICGAETTELPEEDEQ